MFAVMLGVLSFASTATAIAAEPDRPNIILIMADDIGVDGLGVYGGTGYATPNLDRLAAEGLRFDHAYAQPLCTNTRLQLMTGLHNNRNWIAFGILDPGAKTIGHFMAEAGYTSCIAGKWQLQSYERPTDPLADQLRGIGMHPKDAGFDHYSLFHSLHTEDKGSRFADPTYLQDGELVHKPGSYGPDEWVDYINAFIEREKDGPFFVYYPMALPHGPMVPTPLSKDWADPAKRLDSDNLYFKDMVEYMDVCVGRIVDHVDELGLGENTLILFYSDNGTDQRHTSQTISGPVRGGKGLTTAAGTHVPAIARWIGTVKPGVSDTLVDSTDFIPTLLEAAGQPGVAFNGLDGHSFYGELIGATGVSKPREWIYSYYDPRPGMGKDRFRLHVSARDCRWKLYDDGRLFDTKADRLEQQPILPEDDTAESKAVRERLARVLVSQMVD
ncbi:sulfatase-like hydrolase/transferase [Algisphaera agarilytica]|uniref:Arylsulfatase A-like enzyme n=1 Tax=Algisphaera agarilytica TaxID=1385975 RepID=A0A7X0H2V4_9BACT|nr:sulfatase-like hydrolase/transferase [Algisphaera agarilytica]MBB6428195.1 arylsulfatase A-like enzyme [Algisphaera agarilytica]